MVRNLETSIKEVDKIFHLADIHIRNYKRHEEYREVFDKAYKYINKHKTENSIIYIGGDLVHSKTDISPELVEMLSNFLNKMANECPTLIILGNHDTNLNNRSRIDALSPIVSILDNPNLYFLSENGYYKFAQLGINVLEVSIDPDEYLPIDGIKDSEVKIAFYHGAVDGAKTDLGIELKNDRVKASMFKGYDLVLLGDIHKRQFISTDPFVAYPSSLIQQNHGETLRGHGLLEWDLKTMSAKEIEIPNNYGYVTLEVEKGEIKNWNENFPQKLRVRIRYKDTSLDERRLVQAVIRSKRTVLEMTTQFENSANNLEKEKFEIQDVRDVEYQNTLLAKYFENDEQVNPKVLDNLRQVNREVNSELGQSKLTRNIIWKPLKFEFSNMFSYGEGNVIDFSKMTGTYGIFAPNATGKSSLFDALCFCIYDKCSRTNKASEVMNQDKDSFYCILQYAIQDEVYYIEKTGKKYGKEDKVKVDVDFYTYRNGEKVSLNGSQRDQTNKVIREYVGTYEDFILTALSLQNNNSNFIEKTQKERRDLLSDFFDINVFEELNTIATENIKETRAVVKSLMNKDIESNILENTEEKSKIDSAISVVETDIQSFEKVLNEKISNKEKLLVQLKQVKELPDQGVIEKEIANEKEKLEKEYASQKDRQTQINNLTVDIDQLEKQCKEETALLDLQKQFTEKTFDLKSSLQKVKNEIQTCDTLTQYAQTSVDHLSKHEYDPNCKFCIKNDVVIKGEEAKEKLKNLLDQKNKLQDQEKKFTEELSKVQEMASKVEEEISKVEKVKPLRVRLKDFETEQKLSESRIEQSKTRLVKSQEILEEIKEIKDNIEHNSKINQQIKQAEIEVEGVKNALKAENQKLNVYREKLVRVDTIIEGFQKDLEKLKELNDKFQAYELYIKAVKSSGIPYMIIQKALPTLEGEVNRLLEQIVDFQVRFTSDGKNIDAFITYQEDSMWPLELTSGMEKFISSLGIRTALIRSTSLPKPNFLSIDEGFGVLDSEHLASMSSLFELLKSEFDAVFCISHLDDMKDVVDRRIEVVKQNGFSYVNS
jgi:DNA repair exonuclease SbcCD ATPase subunit